MHISGTVKLFSIAFSLAAAIIACKGKSSQPPEVPAKDTTQPVTEKPVVNEPATVRLVCRDRGTDSLGTPHNDVYLLVGGTETKVKSVNACAEIVAADYARHEIPAEAVAACGGWWAGAGDYYYVVMKEGKPVVFEGWQDEGQKDKGFHWKEFKMK